MSDKQIYMQDISNRYSFNRRSDSKNNLSLPATNNGRKVYDYCVKNTENEYKYKNNGYANKYTTHDH